MYTSAHLVRETIDSAEFSAERIDMSFCGCSTPQQGGRCTQTHTDTHTHTHTHATCTDIQVVQKQKGYNFYTICHSVVSNKSCRHLYTFCHSSKQKPCRSGNIRSQQCLSVCISHGHTARMDSPRYTQTRLTAEVSPNHRSMIFVSRRL